MNSKVERKKEKKKPARFIDDCLTVVICVRRLALIFIHAFGSGHCFSTLISGVEVGFLVGVVQQLPSIPGAKSVVPIC